MKLRRIRRLKQVQFRKRRAFLWSTQKLAQFIHDEYAKAIRQLQESYLK